MQALQRLSIGLLAWLALVSVATAVSINEIRIDQVGDDTDEYFELVGSPDTSLDDLTYLVIGDGNPAAGSGVIEEVVSLAGMRIPDRGFFLAAENTFGASGTIFDGINVDATVSLNFENNDNVTHMLVNGFFGALGDDLDTDDDGLLEEMPWATVVDAIGLVDDLDTSQLGVEHFYGSGLGFSDIGPDGSFVPGHVYRIPDETGDFVIGQFGLDPNQVVVDDTPGGPNGHCPICDCAWVDQLVAVIVAGTDLPAFDLTNDGMVNIDDLAEWRVLAGASLNASGNPIQEGDANLDGAVDGEDFILWNNNKFSAVPAWCAGDFNADGLIDGQDFILWNNNKFNTAATSGVPEPAPIHLIFVTLAFATRWLRLTARTLG